MVHSQESGLFRLQFHSAEPLLHLCPPASLLERKNGSDNTGSWGCSVEIECMDTRYCASTHMRPSPCYTASHVAQYWWETMILVTAQLLLNLLCMQMLTFSISCVILNTRKENSAQDHDWLGRAWEEISLRGTNEVATLQQHCRKSR